MAKNEQNQSNNQQQSGDTSNRGFASMDSERQREIAAEGGRAAHASGNAHEFDSDEAREAGSKSHEGQSNKSGQGGNQNQGGQGGNQNSGGGSSGSSGSGSGSSGSGTRGGTSEQHAEAGRQSHKNDR